MHNTKSQMSENLTGGARFALRGGTNLRRILQDKNLTSFLEVLDNNSDRSKRVRDEYWPWVREITGVVANTKEGGRVVIRLAILQAFVEFDGEHSALTNSEIRKFWEKIAGERVKKDIWGPDLLYLAGVSTSVFSKAYPTPSPLEMLVETTEPGNAESLDLANLFEKRPKKAFLFVWNPRNWDWNTLNQHIDELERGGRPIEGWTVRSHKRIKLGDRAFLIRLGTEPRGIMATGKVVSAPYLAEHWDGKGTLTHHVMIEFEDLLNPERCKLLDLDTLNKKIEGYNWSPQSSGVEIKHAVVEQLEKEWFDVIKDNLLLSGVRTSCLEKLNSYTDGRRLRAIVTRYERNPHARRECIAHYGYSCVVCGFNFKSFYGKLGSEFIHVHHLEQVASIGEEHDIDPVKDLRPVCPNCHAMIHKRKVPYSIDEMKNILQSPA